MRRAWLLLGLIGCTTEDTDVSFNESPVAEITSHANGATVSEGDVITLRGLVSDTDDESTDLVVTWHDGDAQYCASAPPDQEGLTECAITIGAEAAEVVLDVVDPDGAAASFAITLIVSPTDAPTVAMTSPVDMATYYEGTLISFEGNVSDNEDASPDLEVWFESSQDGVLPLSVSVTQAGVVTAVGTLKEGSQTITLNATDSTGKSSAASAIVRVTEPNVPPLCEITAPKTESISELGDSVELVGVVSDENVDVELLSATWSSNRDGPLGDSVPDSKGVVSLASKTLSIGPHLVTLTASDEVSATCTAEVALTIGTVPVLVLTSPLKGDVITTGDGVQFAGTLEDNEDSAEKVSVEWASDLDGVFSYQGAESNGSIELEYSALTAGQHVVTVTATDTHGLTGATSVELTINDRPSAPTVSISPNPVDSSEDLVASIDKESVDPEGSSVSYTWAWLKDGIDSGDSSDENLSSDDTSKGEVWTVQVTPNDGDTDGDVGTASITIDNGTPFIDSVTLSPDPAYTDDTINITIDATDPDGDTLSYTYEWYVDDFLQAGGSSILRGTSSFDKGQDVYVDVTPSDGTVQGDTVSSPVVTVENTVPVVNMAMISGAVFRTDSELSVLANSSDDDGDDIEISYVWYVDGVEVAETGETLDGAIYFDIGQEVWAELTPDDGEDAGDTFITNSVVIDNTAPVIDSVTIEPSEAWTDDTLTAIVVGSDADSDVVTFAYSWRVDGVAIPDAISDTLDGTLDFDRDDVVTVVVTPNDGSSDGYSLTSDGVTIQNTAPETLSVALNSEEIYTNDVVGGVLDSSDADEDSITYSYSWEVDGVEVSTGQYLSGSFAFDKGQDIQLTVEPTDGDLTGDAVSSALVTVLNSPPVVDLVVISPSSPSTEDILTVAVTADDDDDDILTYSYAWFVDGIDIGVTEDSLNGADWFGAGATISVQVTANDGEGDSESVLSGEVAVGNTAPVIDSLAFDPSPFYTDDVLSAVVEASDLDGDGVTLSYTWMVNGVSVGEEATLDGSVFFYRDDRVILRVTPTDGELTGSAVTVGPEWVENSPPEITTAELSASAVYTNDSLTVSATADDADGDSSTLEYTWYIDGAAAPIDSPSISGAAWFDKGQQVYCEVVATDDADSGLATVTDTITIRNTPPEVISVTLDPEEPGAGETVTATVVTSDLDEDSVSVNYEWYVDGSKIGPVSGNTLDGSVWFDDGQEIYVVVTPNDGADAGDPVTSTSVTSVNAAPEVTSLNLTPAAVYTNDTIVANATTYDDDGDVVTLSYAWYVDGVRDATATTGSLNGVTSFDVGHMVYVQVTPSDGKTFGTPVTSDLITVLNSLPVISDLQISPNGPYTDDILTAVFDFEDDDGDALVYNYQWLVDGVVAGSGPNLSGVSAFDKNQQVQVTVTPHDGTASGDAVTSSPVLVLNSPPEVTEVTLDPLSPSTDETVTATPVGDDVDGDSVTYTYAWYVDGVSVGVTSETLDGAVWFDSGQQVYCRVTPFDGTQYGSPAESLTLTIGNTPPEVTSVTLTPDPATTDGVLSASVTTSDGDGDPVTVSYRWYVDGIALGSETGNTLDGSAWFDRDQAVFVRVTPNDGVSDGSPVSSSAITIINSVPVVTSVAITPDPADTTSTLLADITSTDADSDTVTYSYQWFVDGAGVSGAEQLDSGLFSRDSVVGVTVTPNDGIDSGDAASSVDITIQNAAPSVESVTFSDESPATDDVVTVNVIADDADSDTVTLSYTWFVDGVDVGINANSIDGTKFFSKGQELSVEVIPDDGVATGSLYAAGPITVSNTVPTTTSVAISPVDPATNEVVVATASGADADGDGVTFTYRWLVDGAEVAEVTDTLDGVLYFSRDQEIIVEVTPWDDEGAGEATASTGVFVENTAPVLSAVSISPATPGTDDLLSVEVTSTDDDDDSITYLYSWRVNGTVVAGSGSTLDGTVHFEQGDSVYVEVTPDDGTDLGSVLVADAVEVGNSTPEITSVSLTPENAYTNDNIGAVVEHTDADDDSVSFTYAWFVDGVEVVGETDSTLIGEEGWFGKGQVITVDVSPFDGIEYGVSMSSGELLIQNTSPSVTGVSLTPETPLTEESVSALITTVDPDEDPITYSYRWFVDGIEVAETAAELDGNTWFDKGQTVSVEVTPDDGEAVGVAFASGEVTVGNTAPVVVGVEMAPSSIGTNDTVTAIVEVTDADDDAVTTSFAWFVDGVDTAVTGSSLDGIVYFDVGQEVVVEVVPTDGIDSGSTFATTPLVVGNSVPVVTAVSLLPDPADTNDTLTAVVTSADSDGDSVNLTYAWYVDGVLLFDQTGSTLDGATEFDRDQEVFVSITPDDGVDTGATFSSDVLTVQNSLPTVDAVSVDLSAPYTNDTLTATATGSDVDGDSVSISYSWSIDGVTASETGSTLSGVDWFERDQVVIVTAIPNDGTDDGSGIAAAGITVQNTAPVITGVLLSPSSPDTEDTVFALVTASDDDASDSLTYTYTWLVDGVDAGTSSSTLDGSTYFNAGQSISVVVTATDGTETSPEFSSDTIAVTNSEPSVVSIDLEPGTAYTDDVVTVSAVGEDPDGDSVALSYEWFVNGVTTGETSTDLDGASFFNKGDSITVEVTPSDATGSGTPQTSGALVVSNTLPVLSAVSISPASPTTDTLLTASYAGSDADSDTISVTYVWSLNGVVIGGETGATLSGDAFSSGDVVTVEVTPSDDEETGSSLTSDGVTVVNTAPEIESVVISPVGPTTNDTLTAEVVSDDIDGDAVSNGFVWFVDGVEVSGEVSQTLDGSFFSKDQSVTVTVTPNDGAEDGPSETSAAVTVLNTAPAVISLSLSSSSVKTDDTLSAVTTTTDDDGDSVTLSYTWYVDFVAVAETSADLDGSAYFSKGSSVYVVATPDDGTDSGSSAMSEVVVIENSAPTISAVSISPADAGTDDTLSAVVTSDDADSDSLTDSYTWYVDTVAVSTSETLDGSYFASGQLVMVAVTTSDDTDSSSPFVSDALTISNSAPVVSSVDINPASPSTTDVLAAVVSGADPDGDFVNYSYIWYVNSAAVAESSDLLDGNIWLSSGDTVFVEVTPDDGSAVGATVASGSVTVDNAAPSVTSLVLTPNPAYTNDTIVASVITDDADGHAVSLTYQWLVDGVEVVAETSDTLSGATYFDAGQVVTSTVTPFDGQDYGTAVSAVIDINNTSPVVLSAVISGDPLTNDVVTVDVTTGDDDGDSVTWSAAWFVNGAEVSTGPTLDGSLYFVRGDVVYADITANDGTIDSAVVSSNSVNVGNTAPTAPAIAIIPSVPLAGDDDLFCQVVASGVDVDGDSVSYTITWDADGETYAGATTTIYAGDTVPAVDTCQTQEWTCSVAASDGTDYSATVSAVVGVDRRLCGSLSLANADYTMTGTGGNELGAAVVFAGDVDGDGKDDIFAGAPGVSGKGAVFLVSGVDSADASISSIADQRVGEQTAANVGRSVAAGFDVGGDGTLDLVVGAPDYANGFGDEGVVYLLSGPMGEGTVTSAEARLLGSTAGGQVGASVALLPDTDSDGSADILIGAPAAESTNGGVYLFRGPLSGDIDVQLDADVTIAGSAVGDNLGTTVALVGDITSDGVIDFAVVSPNAWSGGQGAVYIFSGDVADGVLSAGDAVTTIIGVSATDGVSRVSSAGDVNNDGVADLLIGAPDASTGGGAAYLVYGPPISGMISLAGADAVMTATSTGTGASVADVGDMDSDGYSDFAVASDTGAALLYGPVSGAVDLADANLIVTGASDLVIAGGGDVNGDGAPDVVFGSWSDSTAGADSGTIFVILGQ